MDRAQYLQQLHAQFELAHGDVVGLVERATGCGVVDTRRLVRGDEAEVHRVRLADGVAVYVRASFPGTEPHRAYEEAWVMGRAREAGVPAPIVFATETIETVDGQRTAMVISEAPGRQLADVLPEMSASRRWAVMVEIGRVLATMHSIVMPGPGRPDPEVGGSSRRSTGGARLRPIWRTVVGSHPLG